MGLLLAPLAGPCHFHKLLDNLLELDRNLRNRGGEAVGCETVGCETVKVRQRGSEHGERSEHSDSSEI